MIDTNVKGVMYGVVAFLPSLLARNSGDIIVISSDAGRKVFPGGAVRFPLAYVTPSEPA